MSPNMSQHFWDYSCDELKENIRKHLAVFVKLSSTHTDMHLSTILANVVSFIDYESTQLALAMPVTKNQSVTKGAILDRIIKVERSDDEIDAIESYDGPIGFPLASPPPAKKPRRTRKVKDPNAEKTTRKRKGPKVMKEKPSIIKNPSRRRTNVLPVTAKNSLSLAKLESAKKSIERIVKDGRAYYKCLMCKKVLTAPRSAWLHVRRVHFKDRLSCYRCQRKFYDYKGLDQHIMYKCETKPTIENEKPKIPCTFSIENVTNPFECFDLSKTLEVRVRVERLNHQQVLAFINNSVSTSNVTECP